MGDEERDVRIAVDPELRREVNEAKIKLRALKTTEADLNRSIAALERDNGAKLTSILAPAAREVVGNEQLAGMFAFERDHLTDFLAERDAEEVRKAVTGLGADKRALVYILCKRTKGQLAAIAKKYDELYVDNLAERVQKEVGGDLGYFLHAIVTPAHLYDAELLEAAMKGWGTDESLLTEVLCTRSNAELAAAKVAYLQRTGKALTAAVESDVGGAYEKFLLACLDGDRSEDPVAFKLTAQTAAESLHAELTAQSDSDWGGGDGLVLIGALARPSAAQVEEIKSHFAQMAGKSLEQAIKDACRGDLRRALMCRVARKASFYAAKLEEAFSGLGTDEKTMARILGRCTRREVREIGAEYEALTGKSFECTLRSELGGMFEKNLRDAALLRAFGETPNGDDGDAATLEDGPHEGMYLEGSAASALGSAFETFEEAAKACQHPSSTAAGVTQMGADGPFTLRRGAELLPSERGEISWRR